MHTVRSTPSDGLALFGFWGIFLKRDAFMMGARKSMKALSDEGVILADLPKCT